MFAIVGALAASVPPHIVHIMADDTGWNDLGYKNGLIDSPNLDRLAMEGIRLTRHHSFKVCSPSRSSFHTGRYAFSLGLYDNSPAAVPWLPAFNAQAVPQDFTLLPELLKEQGYATHLVGKWHLGHTTRAYTPTYRGYDTFYGYYNAMTEDYWSHTHSVSSGCSLGAHSRDISDNVGVNMSAGTDNGTYEGTLFGQRAVDRVTAHGSSADLAGVPFFMYLAFHNEHDPHQAPLETLTGERAEKIPLDVYKITASLIQTMDLQVGRVIDALNSTGMLATTVIGFSSDNGGPLDHANNWPFRGGKHTFWEGGVRTEAFVWSPLLPKSRRGTEWAGLAHLADWFYTYAVGVGGVAMSRAQKTGPYSDDAKNLWPALIATDAATPSPRTEVAHMIHSPKYYPGNCSLSCFSSRNCPAVLTVGDMKIMIGFVGDPRIVPLNFTAGTDAHGSPTPVKWGSSGGKCNVVPTAGVEQAAAVTNAAVAAHGDVIWALERRFFHTGDGGDDAPDPSCTTGILSPKDHATCCAKSCGVCGGSDCGSHSGGAHNCCRNEIAKSGRKCDVVGPPCVEGGSPGPAPPGPFANRCTSKGLGGHPAPTIDGLCVNGCLFNVTSDPTESKNLFAEPQYATIVATMKARLATLGAAAPPWAAVPEVSHMSKDAFSKAECDAAKKFGAVAPIDV